MTAKAIIAKTESNISASSRYGEGSGDDFVLVKRSELVQGHDSVSRLLSGDHPMSLDATVTPRPRRVEATCNNQTSKSDVKDDEKKETTKVGLLVGKVGKMLSSGGISRLGKNGMYYRTRLHYAVPLSTNSAAGKYLLFLNGGVQLQVNLVSSGGEWTSFNSIFEEFFVHGMRMSYQPNNMNLPNYIDATSTNIQTCVMTVAGYQHSQGAPTDAAATFYQLLNASQSASKHLGKPWRFSWTNIEKFDKNGPVGDATTATHTQTWLNVGDVSKYGGYVSASSYFATNAAASASTFLVNKNFGVLQLEWDVSFRYRD